MFKMQCNDATMHLTYIFTLAHANVCHSAFTIAVGTYPRYRNHRAFPTHPHSEIQNHLHREYPTLPFSAISPNIIFDCVSLSNPTPPYCYENSRQSCAVHVTTGNKRHDCERGWGIPRTETKFVESKGRKSLWKEFVMFGS